MVDSRPLPNQWENTEDEIDSSSITEAIEWKLESYDINKQHLAKYFIFNHSTFNVSGALLSERNGTEKDVEELKRVLKKLNCIPGKDGVGVYHNLPYSKLKTKLEKVAELEDYSDCAAVIIAIFTHGDEGKLFAYDQSYSLSQLWESFSSSNSTKSLIGKPKIFIIQACQGNVADNPREIEVIDAEPFEYEPSRESIAIPSLADFFFIFGSPPGKCSFRTSKGSWMIQTLCKGLDEFKDSLDFQSIITLVKHHISFNMSSNSSYTEFNKKKQVPYETSTLTKKFYLTKSCLAKHPNWLTRDIYQRPVEVNRKSFTLFNPFPKKISTVSRDSSLSNLQTQSQLNFSLPHGQQYEFWITSIIIAVAIVLLSALFAKLF